jgi:glutamate 5-kinase
MKRTLVVKVGTSLLRGQNGAEPAGFVAELAANLCAERSRGSGVALVTSGAVGLGCAELGLAQRPHLVEELQAVAAIGQGQLMGLYESAFRPHGQTVAQVLITRGDMASRRRFQNASRTLRQLLAWGVLPIVNENDTLATEELRFGDNDSLSALVAVALGANELILLTDVDRLYSADPRSDSRAEPISEVRNLAELDALHQTAGGGGSWGTGGMTTKLAAARIATASGIAVRLADGRDPKVLRELLGGVSHGTLFMPSPSPIPDRKGWLAHALVPKGRLSIDKGAETALLCQGASLLCVGVRRVDGKFEPQEPVVILAEDGRELARGLSSQGSAAVGCGAGQRDSGVAVHRDQLVITAMDSAPLAHSPTIPAIP